MNITGNPAKPMVAVIAGATATGKSAVAIAVAQALGGTIINADATQLYADLRVLSARPSDAELSTVPHRLYGVIDGAVACSAADWAALARAEIDAAHAAGRVPILVGGTGLYLRALIDGIAPVPPIDAAVRAEVRGLDPAATRTALAAADPEAAARLKPADRQRTMRALEVVRGTGRTLAEWQRDTPSGIGTSHHVVAAVLHRERAALRQRCETRVDAMLAGGAIDEVATLLERRLADDRPVLAAIGVPPIAAYLGGEIVLDQAREMIAQQTRRYAKRQSTWFRNQTGDWPQFDAALMNIKSILSEYFTLSFRQ